MSSKPNFPSSRLKIATSAGAPTKRKPGGNGQWLGINLNIALIVSGCLCAAAAVVADDPLALVLATFGSG